MGVKPMNCPGHFLLYKSELRSYRDLPIRFADFGVLHRNELAGALGGLTRVRRFCQDDAHIFCTKEQIHQEILNSLDFLNYIYSIFGFEFDLFLSTKPEKYLGDDDLWEEAEDGLRKALDTFGKPWKENPGDGAFYGPKIDITLYDAMKRPHQCGTIQLDFQAPIRFNMLYKSDHDTLGEETSSGISKHSETDTVVKKYIEFPADEFDKEIFKWEELDCKHGFKRPVVIHRAILGSLERFFSILIEHIDGKWPFWLSPKQVVVLPVSEKFTEYAHKVHLAMQYNGFHSSVDDSNGTVNKRIRNAQLAQWNYMLIVGQDETDLGMVNVRTREGKIIGLKRVDELIEMLKTDKPEPATAEKETYENIWKAEDFPFSEEKYQEVLAQEEQKAEDYRNQQEEKKKLAEEKAKEKAAKGGKKEKKKQDKKEKPTPKVASEEPTKIEEVVKSEDVKESE
jgi:threonyl-tRNA synthetase